MTDEEQREAGQLADYLEGRDAELSPDLRAAVGVLRHAGDTETADPWARIATGARGQRRGSNRLALVAYALAAGLTCVALLRPPEPVPLPPEPTLAQRDAAMRALDPSSAPPIQRLGALHEVSAQARHRLVAEILR